MSTHEPTPHEVPADHPYHAEIEAERRGWYEIAGLVRSLSPAECVEPGYYRDRPWTVRDLVAHLGTWLAEAHVQFERIRAGTYEGHDVDIDALNAALLDAMQGQPWEVAWLQANAARSLMVEAWHAFDRPGDEADWWIRKCAADHFDEHIGRLREWTAELIAQRPAGG